MKEKSSFIGKKEKHGKNLFNLNQE